MEDIFVGRLMSAPAHTVDPDARVREAAAIMGEEDIGSVVVTEESTPIGILTATDFIRIAEDNRAAAETNVSEYMSTDIVTTTTNASIREVADTLMQRGVHHVPVVEDEEVIGMISTKDLTGYISGVETPTPDVTVRKP